MGTVVAVQFEMVAAADVRIGDTVVRITKPMRVDFISRVPARKRRLWRRGSPPLVILWSDPNQPDAEHLGSIISSSPTCARLVVTADSMVPRVIG